MRLYDLHRLYFGEPEANKIVPVDEEIKNVLIRELERLHYLEKGVEHSEEAVYNAFTAFIHTENFEERERQRGKIDLDVLEYLKQKNVE